MLGGVEGDADGPLVGEAVIVPVGDAVGAFVGDAVIVSVGEAE